MTIFSKNRLISYIKNVSAITGEEKKNSSVADSGESKTGYAEGRRENEIKYNNDSGVYTIKTDKEDFRILQLTDIHLGGTILSYGRDKKALMACEKLIRHTQPDLVVVTGDLTYPMRGPVFSYDNKRLVRTFAAFMRHLSVPWAFTFGNHDSDDFQRCLSRLFCRQKKTDFLASQWFCSEYTKKPSFSFYQSQKHLCSSVFQSIQRETCKTQISWLYSLFCLCPVYCCMEKRKP